MLKPPQMLRLTFLSDAITYPLKN
jgi:hypothetical protein